MKVMYDEEKKNKMAKCLKNKQTNPSKHACCFNVWTPGATFGVRAYHEFARKLLLKYDVLDN